MFGCWDFDGRLVDAVGAEVEVGYGEDCAGEKFLYGFGLVVYPLEVELKVFVLPHVL